MKTSERMLKFLKDEELSDGIQRKGVHYILDASGAKLYVPYPDPKGLPTIAFGHLIKSGEDFSKGLTEIEAVELLRNDVKWTEDVISNHVKVPLSQGQFDALVSIIFNIGPGSPEKDGIIRLRSGKPSTLLRKLNTGDYEGAAAEFQKWRSPGTPLEHALRARRLREETIFLGG